MENSMAVRIARILTAFLSAIFIYTCRYSTPCSAQESSALGLPLNDIAPPSSLEYAESLIGRSDFARVRSYLEGYLQQHSDSADGHYLLAYTLLRLNIPDRSLQEYTAAARMRTPSAKDLLHVAQNYILLNDSADAEKWMNRAIQLNEADADIWYGLGRLQYSNQKFESATKSFQKTLQLEPRSVKAENNLGLAYEALNRNQDAIAAYRAAIDLEKTSAHPSEQPIFNLGAILLNSGDPWQAEPLLRQAILIAPKDPKIREKLGDLYTQRKQFDEARVEYQEAIAISPNNASLHYLLAQTYKREGLKNEADIEFSRASVLLGNRATPAQ
jgi:tetratricopeptide (TPR) repeat protein